MTDRFTVTWIPLPTVEAVASKRGMRPEDGSSFMDWLEPDDFQLTEACTSFREALAVARRKRPLDMWNAPRITEWRIDDCKVWHEVCFWDATPELNRHSDPDHIL